MHGAVEPCIVHLGEYHLVVVMRTVDDESNLNETSFGPASDTYEDLTYAVRGDGVYPGVAHLNKDKFYTLGPPSTHY